MYISFTRQHPVLSGSEEGLIRNPYEARNTSMEGPTMSYPQISARWFQEVLKIVSNWIHDHKEVSEYDIQDIAMHMGFEINSDGEWIAADSPKDSAADETRLSEICSPFEEYTLVPMECRDEDLWSSTDHSAPDPSPDSPHSWFHRAEPSHLSTGSTELGGYTELEPLRPFRLDHTAIPPKPILATQWQEILRIVKVYYWLPIDEEWCAAWKDACGDAPYLYYSNSPSPARWYVSEDEDDWRLPNTSSPENSDA
jgi:hypothetical protein